MKSLGQSSITGFGNLPEDCISSILSFTTPPDVGRLALVSHKWRSAADSNALWKKMLPHHYYQIFPRAVTPEPDFPSMKQLYLRLRQSLLIDNGTKRIWVDRRTGKVGCMVSARDLSIIWGDNKIYWDWVSCEDSRFEEVAKLNYVCWFDVKGRFDCTLLSPNTRYRVLFVVKTDENYGTPFSFSLDSVNGDHIESARYLRPAWNDWMEVEGQWMEFVIGEFFLEEDEGIPREIRFYMKNTDCTVFKREIWIEGVRIEPVC